MTSLRTLSQPNHLLLALTTGLSLLAGCALDVASEAPGSRGIHLLAANPGASHPHAAVREAGGRVLWSHQATGLMAVQGLDARAADGIAALAGVQTLARDGLLVISDPDSEGPGEPGDPGNARAFHRQWNMRAIRADAAWDAGRHGSPDVTVAVVDTGIDYLHRDLVGRVDLGRSISFVPEDDQIVAERFPDRHPVTDLNSHGTHVAATIASNGHVTAGVTSQVTLMGVKVANAEGEISVSGLLQGLLYAVDEGADVVNVSIGGGFSRSGHGGWIDQIRRALGYAWANGVVVVVGAGNAGTDLDHDGDVYQALCDAELALCVSATDGEQNILADYSNFGAPVDVAGPGGGASPVWAACSGTSLRHGWCEGHDDQIVGLHGTSMAAPHITGLAALLASEHEGYGLWTRTIEVRNAIQRGATDLGEPGRDGQYGYGLIDVATSLGLR